MRHWRSGCGPGTADLDQTGAHVDQNIKKQAMRGAAIGHDIRHQTWIFFVGVVVR